MPTSHQAHTIKILVAVDGSAHADAALRWVISLRHAGLVPDCVLLHVQRPVMSGEVGLISPADVVAEHREHAGKIVMTHAADILGASGLTYTPLTQAQSDIPAALLDCAAHHGCEAIVVGRRGQGALRAALLGSVSTGVIHGASLPTIVVNPEVPPLTAAPLRILLATDGSSAANRAAGFAGALACRAARGEVHLLHVRPDITMAEAILGPAERLIEQWSGLNEGEALDSARDIIVRSGAACHVFRVVAGEPHQVILSAAAEIGCSLIAMGTRGLGPVTGALAGSVAQHVVKAAQVPVLLAR